MIKSTCKSGSSIQGANDDVRDVVVMPGKAASEGIARASGLHFYYLSQQTSVQVYAGFECCSR